MATCFDRKTVIIRPIKNILRYNKVRNQCTLKVFFKNVLYWPDDDRLTVETCCHNVI